MDFQSAMNEYDLILSLNSEHPGALERRAECGRELLRAREAWGHFSAGVNQFAEGRFAESIASFERALGARVFAGSAHYYRAMAWSRLGKKAGALRELDRAVEVEPQNPLFRAEVERARRWGVTE